MLFFLMIQLAYGAWVVGYNNQLRSNAVIKWCDDWFGCFEAGCGLLKDEKVAFATFEIMGNVCSDLNGRDDGIGGLMMMVAGGLDDLDRFINDTQAFCYSKIGCMKEVCRAWRTPLALEVKVLLSGRCRLV